MMQNIQASTTENDILTFDNRIINISRMSISELWSLHYEQEKAFANLIRESKPFSVERAQLMKKGYGTINKIETSRTNKEGRQLESFGSVRHYAKLIKKLLRDILNKKGNCMFLEAGIGTGKIIKEIAVLPNVNVMGCDTYIDRSYISANINVFECTIYEFLNKLEDNSIDVFYWNDVMEHIPEDEIKEHIKLLHKKMAPGGLIITITPNRLKGPCDITWHFEPHGTIAKGFHFHEYTFQEVLNIFKEYNLVSAYSILGYTKKGWYVLMPVCADKIKLFIEKIAAVLPYIIKRPVVAVAGCDVSIIEKLN